MIMPPDVDWKRERALRDFATKRGEEVARDHAFGHWPVDPFRVIESERSIYTDGTDFGDSFDGRLSYHGERFLLAYNTRYNTWPKRGPHHPKVRFTVAHELGHFYLDDHRTYLVKRRCPHGSFVEFESQSSSIERQADAFAAGLLMPGYLLSPYINRHEDPSLASIKTAASDFDVSMTSMMVRWTQLSHFPCAAISIRNQRIDWGFVSEGFRRARYWRARRAQAVSSAAALRFSGTADLSSYRDGQGTGSTNQWLESDQSPVPVQEFYAIIPYSQTMMVFLVADERDLPEDTFDEE